MRFVLKSIFVIFLSVLSYFIGNFLYESLAYGESGPVGSSNARKIQGRNVSSAAPSNANVIAWNTAASRWEPQAAASTGMATDMSNMAVAVAASGDLVFNKASASVRTKHNTAATEAITFQSGNVTSGGGASGGVFLTPGNSVSGNTGTLAIGGAAATSGNGGQLTIFGLGSDTGTPGSILITSGTASAGSANGGDLTLNGGPSSGGIGGSATLNGGTSILTSGFGGAVTVQGGANIQTGGTGGSATFVGGTGVIGGNTIISAGVGGTTQGILSLQNIGEGTSGHCLISQNTTGKARWAACPGAGSDGAFGLVQFSDGASGFDSDSGMKWNTTAHALNIGIPSAPDSFPTVGQLSLYVGLNPIAISMLTGDDGAGHNVYGFDHYVDNLINGDFAIRAYNGTTTPTDYFHIARGTGNITLSALPSCAAGIQSDGAGLLSCIVSDGSLKNVKTDFKKSLDALKGIRPKLFTWKKRKNFNVGDRVDAGFIAQNVMESIPEAVIKNKDGTLVLMDRALMAVMVNAINELSAEIKLLKAKK